MRWSAFEVFLICAKQVILKFLKGISYRKGVFYDLEDISGIDAVDWDHRLSTDSALSLSNKKEIPLYQYPAVFYLSKIVREEGRDKILMDFGGGFGRHYFVFKQYFNMNTLKQWLVFDLPNSVMIGRELAMLKDESTIQFTTEIADIKKADIVYANGSFQHIGDSFFQFLLKDHVKADYVLINYIEIVEEPMPSFWTIKRHHDISYPFKIYNEQELLKNFCKSDYVQENSWKFNVKDDLIFGKKIEISQKGYCFRRKRIVRM